MFSFGSAKTGHVLKFKKNMLKIQKRRNKNRPVLKPALNAKQVLLFAQTRSEYLHMPSLVFAKSNWF
jgi:hypothetical protein